MNKPKIRFMGYEDAWEQRKVEDIMSCITDYVAAGSFADIRENVTYLNENGYAQLVRTVDLKKKFTNDDFVFVDENAFKYLWRVNLNEVCIALPNIGANIGEVYYVEPSELPEKNNVLGPNAILLRTNEDKYFVFILLSSDVFQKQLFENVGSSGQPKFNKTELKSIAVSIPDINEQKKIGSYFKSLDYLITLHQRKCEETKTLKKYMLQKMFPQNGTIVPEIRFDGFTDAWEQRKLGEVCKEIGDGLHSAPIYDENGNYFFINGNNLTDGHIVIDKIETKKVSEATFLTNDKNLNNQTILMSINGTIGNLAYYKGENVMLGKSVAYLKCGNIDKMFLFTTLQTKIVLNDFMLSLTGTTIKNLGLKAIKNTSIYLPSKVEQIKIGKYFAHLDHLITLHQRKCDELVKIKKYMLQNMFV